MGPNEADRIYPDTVLHLHGHRVVLPGYLDPVRHFMLLGDDADQLEELNRFDPRELVGDHREESHAHPPPGNDAVAANSADGPTHGNGEHRSQADPGPGDGASVGDGRSDDTVDAEGGVAGEPVPVASTAFAPQTKIRNRPRVRIRGGSLSQNATDAERHLIDAGVQIYRRGSKLVRPVTEEVSASDGRKTRAAALLEVSEVFMRDLLCQHMDWQKWDERKKVDEHDEKWRNVDPPPDVAKVILARAGEWGFPAVVGITSTPTMRADGTVLSDVGYDKQTGLILFEPPEMPEIPDQPTRDDALAALAVLCGLLAEVPFVDEASRSVVLSALITPSVRAALPAAPMHVFTSPTAGTGKSYLVDIISSVYSGMPCPVIGKGESSGELEKRLNTSLVAGHPMVSIDNVNGELGGDFLCHAIERPMTDIRILGRTQHARIQNTVTLFATGNNLRLVGDVTRRSLLASIDAKVERPEMREFKSNPVATVMANRGRYIAAALTIVKAHMVAGSPSPRASMQIGGFQKWSDLVRSALIWLGREDPVKTMDRARDNDPELETLQNVLSAIGSEFGFGPEAARTAAEMIATAYPASGSRQDSPLPHALDCLRQKGKLDAVVLGQWLAQRKDRIVADLQLVKISRGRRGSQWYVINQTQQQQG
jgi:putative DNA primase/helicase